MIKEGKKTAALFMAVVLSLGSAMTAGATDKKIDDVKKETNQLQNQKDMAVAEQKKLTADLNVVMEKMKDTNAKIDKKALEIEDAENDYVKAKVDEDRQYQNMKKRIRFMYESGDTKLLEVMLTADSIADMLNKAEYVTKISEYDRKMLDEFKAIVEEVKHQEKQLKKEYDKLGKLQDQLGEQHKQVQNLLESKGVEIANLESAIGTKAAELKALIKKAQEEEEARKQAELAQQQKPKPNSPSKPSGGNNNNNSNNNNADEPSGGNNSNNNTEKPSGGNNNNTDKPSGGNNNSNNNSNNNADKPSGGNTTGIRLSHPCPSGYVTSGFGYRDFDNSFHNGIDYGTGGAAVPTYAAADGKVVIAGWSNSAGNWVVISHGNGLVTKYMHHSTLYVSAGQSVSRGQALGLTGNTGNSFGVHLHFQVELNGVAVNPANYY